MCPENKCYKNVTKTRKTGAKTKDNDASCETEKNERFSREAARMCAFSSEKQHVPPFSSPSIGEKGRTEAAPPEHANVTGAKQFRFPMTIKRRPERRAER